MTWKPDPASLPIEVEMEAKDIPEQDRDEVRRFVEFLRWKSDKQAGKEPAPLTDEMRAWLLGELGKTNECT